MVVAKSITLVCSACLQNFHPKSAASLLAKHPCCSIPCRKAHTRSFAYVVERFWEKVGTCPHGPVCLDCCWPWEGRIHPVTGYGEFDVTTCNPLPDRTGHIALTHRIAYFLHHGAIISDLLVCHTCDFRACVNVSHLFQGTHKDNGQDMVAKGRSLVGDRNWTHQYPEKVLRGERHPMAKISDAQAETILLRYQQGNISQRALAAVYNVSQLAIWRIVKHKRRIAHV